MDEKYGLGSYIHSKMSIKKHLALSIVVIALWAGFYLTGLPSDYYTKWSDAEKMLLTMVAFFGALPFTVFVVGVFLGEDYFKTGVWLAVYGSVVPFILDFIVVGMIEGKGLGFLTTHWPQSIGYLEVIVIGPLIGSAMKRLTK